MSEEQEERVEIDNNNGNFEESSDIVEPLEVIREEVVEVDTETSSMASMEDQDEEEEDQKKTDNSNRYNGDIYEQYST